MRRNKLFWILFFILCLAAAVSACTASGTPAGSSEDAPAGASAMLTEDAPAGTPGTPAALENASAGASAMLTEDAPAGTPAALENAPAGVSAASTEDAPADASAASTEEVSEASAETKTIRIIGTSDLHGKFVPWDYYMNQENLSGSVAQLSTAIKEYRTENTLLMDAGDTIQDNSADIFLNSDDVHPMIQAMNALNYDVWVTGNHDYNYGMEIMEKTIADLDCKVLTGNVYDKNGEPIADGCTVFTVDGVRIAVIGMVTPNIARWDATNLEGCKVTDPLEETRAIIDEMQGRYDVLVGVFHMGIDNEYNVPNSGVTDILKQCPEFDVVISSHMHTRIAGEDIYGALVVQNKNKGQTMAVINLTLEKDRDGWKVTDKSSESIEIAAYEPDPAIVDLLEKYDEQAKKDAETVIGKLEGGPLVPANGNNKNPADTAVPENGENEMSAAQKNGENVIPVPFIRDTPLMELLNRIQMYYADAPVSTATLSFAEANLYPGDIRKCDVNQIYRYSNTLYKVHMNGGQLKKYMERSAEYFNTFHPGDTTISVNPDMPDYLYQMLEGVNYEINISREPGSRIENLTWPDGTPIQENDEFDVAINNYNAVSEVLVPGVIFEEDELPTLVDVDIRSDIGGIREMIIDYIVNVKGGTITPEVNDNWRITGDGT